MQLRRRRATHIDDLNTRRSCEFILNEASEVVVRGHGKKGVDASLVFQRRPHGREYLCLGPRDVLP